MTTEKKPHCPTCSCLHRMVEWTWIVPAGWYRGLLSKGVLQVEGDSFVMPADGKIVRAWIGDGSPAWPVNKLVRAGEEIVWGDVEKEKP